MGQDENPHITHLSPDEQQQMLLHPTAEAVYDYLEGHPEIERQTRGVGIDREMVSVTVFWAGNRFDSDTQAAFSDISARTGFPIVAVPVVLRGDEVRIVHDRVFAEQDGVKTIGGNLLTDPSIIHVGVVGSLDGRPDSMEVNGRTVALRYHLSDMQPLHASGIEE